MAIFVFFLAWRTCWLAVFSRYKNMANEEEGAAADAAPNAKRTYVKVTTLLRVFDTLEQARAFMSAEGLSKQSGNNKYVAFYFYFLLFPFFHICSRIKHGP